MSKAETNDKKQVALKGLTNSVIEENVIKNLVKEVRFVSKSIIMYKWLIIKINIFYSLFS